MPTLLLGITGGIAAYKSVDLASRLRKRGWEVHIVMTEAATRFVTPLTFESITRLPVRVGDGLEVNETGGTSGIEHIELGKGLDAFLIAPATANTLAKLAHGLADDLLTTTALAADCPLVVAPAMNPRMWANPATQANLATLRERGVVVLDPDSGEMACGDVGVGRMPEPAALADWLEDFVGSHPQPQATPVPATSTVPKPGTGLAEHRPNTWHAPRLTGKRILVTAGGTREAIDPVRYIGNRSSGKMGLAVAIAAVELGAEVVLVTTRPSLQTGAIDHLPGSLTTVIVETAAEMREAVITRYPAQDVVVMAAAVADYRPAEPYRKKRKKGNDPNSTWTLELVANPDILLELGQTKRPGQVLVGFAAETGAPVAAAQGKLARKNADFIVANDVSKPAQGFEVDTNRVVVVGPTGIVADLPLMAKSAIGRALWNLVYPPAP